jgi:hypothetical protein
LPHSFISQTLKGTNWERSLLRLEFLKTNDIRLTFRQPCQKVLQPFIDIVDVEGGDFHF